MKLHIGSGSVYLEGWKNIDVEQRGTFLAHQRPDLVEKWKTTDCDYYARHGDKTADSLRAGPLAQEYVCDAYGSFTSIPGPYWEADEILSRQSFEHLSIAEAHRALDEMDGILKPNGILRLDVPDHEGTMQRFRETGDEFYIRHLLGPRRNDRGFHLMSYTRERLKSLVEEHGFVFVEEEPNIHFYPAFCMRFVKPGPRAPRDYVPIPEIQPNWRVLDVGPGGYPHPAANMYADVDHGNLEALQASGKGTIIGNLMDGFPQVDNKSFDYVWCSHVLEHVPDPVRAAAVLSRIGKRGTVVLPSAMKEGLFGHEETDHKWLVLPAPKGKNAPVFVRPDSAYIDKLRDPELQRIMCRLLRTGPNRVAEQRYLRQWFYRNEPSLDIVVHWEGRFEVQVIG